MTAPLHSNAPKKLIRLWHDHPAYYQIAKHLNVNPATVWQAMVKGKEPKNEDIRQKFGLPRRQYKPRTKPRIRQPDYIRWWRGLDQEIRDMYIKETFTEWSSKRP